MNTGDTLGCAVDLLTEQKGEQYLQQEEASLSRDGDEDIDDSGHHVWNVVIVLRPSIHHPI